MDEFTDTPHLSSEHSQIRLKVDELFLVSDEHGDIRSDTTDTGLYCAGTRYLNDLRFQVESHPWEELSHGIADDAACCTFDLAISALDKMPGIESAERSVHLGRSIKLGADTISETFTFTSYQTAPVDLSISLHVGADFRDIFEIRGIEHAPRGKFNSPVGSTNNLVLSYLGRDQIARATRLEFNPPASVIEPISTESAEEHNAQRISWHFCLTRAQPIAITVRIRVWEGEPATPENRRWRKGSAARNVKSSFPENIPALVSDNAAFNQTLKRGINDLVMMCTRTPYGLYPYGGIPWYVCPFGRDGLIASLEFLPWFPEVARGTLDFLAAHQGMNEDDFTEEQPGKILHELRQGELANLREIPFIPYFGTVDATPLFIIALEQYIRWTNDTDLLQRLWPNARAAAQWIVDYGDLSGNGFLEYQRSTSTGLVNQGWKDSWDAISHADGRLADGPIALCEAQAYAYAAFHAIAYLAQRSGHDDEGEGWLARASELRARFIEKFWWPEQQCYYLALDGSQEPCKVVSSNAGQCLWAAIAPQEHAAAIVERLMRPDMYTGWGIRTLSSQAARYNPMSYHNGSVWPHDTALIGAGFARYGFREEAMRLLGNLYSASSHYEGARLPELLCGFSRVPGYGPTHYPVACSPQSWAAGAPFLLISAMLGFEPDAEHQRLTLHRPTLPVWLTTLEMHGLRVGEMNGQMRLLRSDSSVMVNLSHASGVDVHVLPQ